jgi:hypothetical protein
MAMWRDLACKWGVAEAAELFFSERSHLVDAFKEKVLRKTGWTEVVWWLSAKTYPHRQALRTRGCCHSLLSSPWHLLRVFAFLQNTALVLSELVSGQS